MADDVKNPNPNLIDEKDIPANWVPAAGSPSSPQGAAPPLPNEMPTFFSGSMAPALQHDKTFVGTEVASPRVPKFSLMPFGNQASPFTNAAAQSTATKTVVETVTTPGTTPATDVESIFINPQAGTQYTVQVADRAMLDTFNNNAGGIIVLPGPTLSPGKFSSQNLNSGGGTSMTATGAPFNAGSAVIFLGTVTEYAFQTGIVPSGSGWNTIDAGANGVYASIYSKLLPDTSPLTVTATIGSTAWGEALLFFQNVNIVPTKVQEVILSSGAFGTGTISAAFPNPVTKGNMILVYMSGRPQNDSFGNPVPVGVSCSDGVNTYQGVGGILQSQLGGPMGPQAGYNLQQEAFIAQNVAGGSTTVSWTFSFPTPPPSYTIAGCTVTAYEISMGNASAIPTGFTDGWYCYLENTGSGAFSVQSTALIDGSSSPVSMGSNSGLIVAFDGTNWFTERGSGGGGGSVVTSFNGRTGAVVPTTGDYTVAQVTDAASLTAGVLTTSEFPGLTGDATVPSGSLASTVVKIQGRAVTSAAPNDADILTWVAGNSDWEPKPISALGGANASQLRGKNISVATPIPTQILQWNQTDNSYDLVYNDYQPYATLWNEDFLTSRATQGGALLSPFGGGPSAWATCVAATAPTAYSYNQLPSHLGVFQTTLLSATANVVSALMPCLAGGNPLGAIPGSSTLALLDNPGWRASWIFNFSRAWGEGAINSSTAFSIAHTIRYIGFANGLNSAFTSSGTTYNTAFGTRPNIFLGVRYDTDTGVTMNVTAVGSGTGVYTVNGGSAVANFYAGNYITFANCGNAANNGTFMVKSSTSTSLTTTNTSSVLGSGLTGTAVQPSLNDTTFKFEYVTNPFPFLANATTTWRNNNSGTVTFTGGTYAAGTVVDTHITPVEGQWYRLDMVCAATGVVTLTLSGGGSSSTTTITCGKVSMGDGSTNWTWSQANGAVTATPGALTLRADGTNIQSIVWGPGSILSVTTIPTGLTTPFTMIGSNSSNMVIGYQSGALSGTLTQPSIITGYPALWPMDIFGNDQSNSSPSTLGARAWGVDFFGLYYDPAIAAVTYDATQSRYFTGT